MTDIEKERDDWENACAHWEEVALEALGIQNHPKVEEIVKQAKKKELLDAIAIAESSYEDFHGNRIPHYETATDVIKMLRIMVENMEEEIK